MNKVISPTASKVSYSLKKAYHLFTEGHYKQVIKACDTILKHHANHPSTLNLKGLAIYRSGNLSLAITLLQQAYHLNKTNRVFQNNLATLLKEQGKYTQAIQLFKNILQQKPDFIDAYHSLAQCYLGLQKPVQAITYLKTAVHLKPQDLQIRQHYANMLLQCHQTNQAITEYKKITAKIPDFSTTCVQLGLAFQYKKRYPIAQKYYLQALQLNPLNPTALCHLGWLAKQKGKYSAAIRWYHRALAIDNQLTTAYLNLGKILHYLNKLPAALECYHKLIQLNSQSMEAYNRRGSVYYALNQVDQAIVDYKRAIDGKKDYMSAQINYAFALLAAGDYQAGWQAYEERLKRFNLPHSQGVKRWQGESLANKTLLICTENNPSDTLQFIRYLSTIDKKNTRIILQCAANLTTLLKGVTFIDEVINQDQPLPQCDYYFPLLSFPLLRNTDPSEIPTDIPYLKADPKRVKHYHALFQTPTSIKRIGISWQNTFIHPNNLNHVIPLKLFASLTTIKNTQFYSFQQGKPRHSLDEDLPIVNLSKSITDFADMAACLDHMDLIITADTVVAHLASAMGKTVWNLVPCTPDYRWPLHQENSPWYPTMRLFRQAKIGDWQSVLTQVKLALSRLT